MCNLVLIKSKIVYTYKIVLVLLEYYYNLRIYYINHEGYFSALYTGTITLMTGAIKFPPNVHIIKLNRSNFSISFMCIYFCIFANFSVEFLLLLLLLSINFLIFLCISFLSTLNNESSFPIYYLFFSSCNICCDYMAY